MGGAHHHLLLYYYSQRTQPRDVVTCHSILSEYNIHMDKNRLHQILDYHPDGYFIWKEKTNRRVVVGSRAGWTRSEYDQIKVEGKVYTVHRLVFFYHHGYFPKMVDHINGDKKDNRIENLRECSASQNSQNRKKRTDNTSGESGVSPCGNRWQVSVTVDSRVHWGGRFNTKQEAVKRARELKEKYQGEFLSTR